MPLLIRTIFTLQYIKKCIHWLWHYNYNSFINSSFINNSVSTLNLFTYSGYPPYILITLSINLYTLYFFIENKTSDIQKKPIHVSLQIFRKAKKSTIDRNINFHHNTHMHAVPKDTVYMHIYVVHLP